MRDYTFQRIDAVYIVSNEFKSILAPQIMTHRVLPLEPAAGAEASALLAPDWEPGDAAPGRVPPAPLRREPDPSMPSTNRRRPSRRPG